MMPINSESTSIYGNTKSVSQGHYHLQKKKGAFSTQGDHVPDNVVVFVFNIP